MAGALAPVMRTGHPNLFTVDKVDAALRKGRSARVDENVPARFTAGDCVRARRIHPTGHTRLPRYARGARGVIVRDHGVHIFADSHAMALGKNPQHLYSVRFEAGELWGEAANANNAIYVDLWDAHLEPV